MTTEFNPESIDHVFTSPMTTEANSGWTCVVVVNSGTIFGTRRAIKVAGSVDGHDFEATMLPIGDGTHMLPIKAALRRRLGKDLGDVVSVRLTERRS
jgi:hypothetical protein